MPTVSLGQRGMGETVLLHDLRIRSAVATQAIALESIAGRRLEETMREIVDDLVAWDEGLPERAGNAVTKSA